MGIHEYSYRESPGLDEWVWNLCAPKHTTIEYNDDSISYNYILDVSIKTIFKHRIKRIINRIINFLQ